MPAKSENKKEVKAEEVVGGEVPEPVVIRPEPEQVLLEWKAPVRPFRKRSKQFWTTAFMMAFLVGLIFLFVEGWMPVVVVIAFMFLVYVMSSVPPEEITHQITTRGVSLGGSKYTWREMVRFWISEKWGQKLVNVDLVRLPGRISFLAGGVDPERLKQTISKYVVYEEAKPNFIEKASSWLGKTFPLETE